MTRLMSKVSQPKTDSLASPCDRIEEALQDYRKRNRPEACFQIIVDCFYPRVLRFLNRYVSRPEDRDDVAQETFLQVYRNLDSFRGEARFSTWLFQIAYHSSTRIRRSFRQVSLDESESHGSVSLEIRELLGATEDSQLTSLLQKERRDLLRRAVNRLPLQQRRCMELRIYQGRSYQEIADLLQISIDAVKVNLYHGRERLKEELSSSRCRAQA